MDLTAAGPVKAQLAIVGMKVDQQSQAAAAQVVAQALENAVEIAKAAPPPASGRGGGLDTSA
jgi:hypothetical protein